MNKKYFLILLITLLAFSLRFYKITEVPPSLNWDEASIGYNAYSILETGRDEWGKLFPIHFKSYGEYKLPGQIYASIPGILIFGLTPFGVRITPVIYGTLTVLLVYLLGVIIFKDKRVGLISALLMAISPWHIQLTRASFESSLALMWVVLGMILLIKGFQDRKWWIVSILPFSLAIYTYNSARAFIPIFLIFSVVLYRKELLKYKKYVLVSLTLFILLMIPLANFVYSGEGEARYKLVSVTDEAGLIPRIEERRNLTSLPTPIKELVHNRYSYVSFYVINNYLSHFTPDFLFISGAGHSQHHPQGIGQLYWIQAPFLLFGFYCLIKSKNRYSKLLIAWLLAAIIPVALTKDSIPHALRTLNAAPVYQIITAYGFVTFINIKSKKKNLITFIIFGAVLLLVYQFLGYQHRLYNGYPNRYSRDWQYGYEQVVEYIEDNYNKYDLIVFTREYGEPHMFTLFYLKYPPGKFQNDTNLERFETFDWVRVSRFDKFYFPDLGDEGTRIEDIININQKKKLLFIGTEKEIPDEMKIIKTINFLDGTRAFEVVEVI